MPYSLDFAALGTEFAKRRLSSEELGKGFGTLREGLGPRLAALDKSGLKKLSALHAALSDRKRLESLASALGIPADWLAALARALGSWRPAPFPLADYPGADRGTLEALAEDGIDDGRELWDEAHPRKSRASLCRRLRVAPEPLLELSRLAELSRVEGVDPALARVLLDAGYPDVEELSKAEPAALSSALAPRFKGKEAMKEAGRLVFLAKLLPFDFEE